VLILRERKEATKKWFPRTMAAETPSFENSFWVSGRSSAEQTSGQGEGSEGVLLQDVLCGGGVVVVVCSVDQSVT
jgi:hypothetical protein